MGVRRNAGVVAGLLSVGAVAAAITAVALPETPSSGNASAGPTTSTTDITRQTLIDRESHDGILGHGDTTTISSRSAGTVTGLPAEGTTIARGQAIFRLDNQPVTLLYGSLPAYRGLAIGIKGVDVLQFERNLRALGYRGFTVDKTYTSSTASAVRAWQEDLHRTRTGAVDPGQIVYARAAVRVNSLSTQLGAVVGPGVEVEKVTGTSTLATVQLDTSSLRLARLGAAVRVTMPDGKIVAGKIIKVATFVTPGENGAADTTGLQATIRFESAVRNLGAAAVSVAFTAGQRPNVLAVPVAALLALAEGGYGVQVVDAGTRIVPVDTGLFADGRVEITGAGLRAGLKVAMPS
jgi:peptidoglycan hydrolase-like protein with peptidoglycan-binding domain